MKNSILEKARWLRDVALATSKNNGARVAREWLKYAAMFVMLFTIGVGNAWGQITVDENPKTSETYTISCAKGNGSSAPADQGNFIRCYAKNTITISTTGSNMTQIVIAWTKNSKKDFATVTANTGSYNHPNGAGNGTWTGNANSVTFTVGSSGQIQITQVTITSAAGGGSCSECTYYVYNGTTWEEIGTTGFYDVVLAPPTLPSNNHGAGNGCWVTDKNIYDGGDCVTYTSGDKYRYVPNPGGDPPDAENKPGNGTCELYAVYWDGGCLSTKVKAAICARIWEKPKPNTPSVSGSDVTLSWSSVTGASGYHLYVTDGYSDVFNGNVDGTSKTLTGLAGGTYMWTVAANSSDGDACDSKPADGEAFVIDGCTDISSSTVSSANISITPAKTTATISWSAVANASSYEVKVYAGATASGVAVWTASPAPTSTSCTATGLTANTQYTVAIKAKNACSTSSTAGTKTFETQNLTLYHIDFVNQNNTSSHPAQLEQTSEGQNLDIPANSGGNVTAPSAACSSANWTFAGWKVGSAQEETTSAPSLVAAGTTGYAMDGNKTFYAVFTKTEGGGGGVKTTLLSSTCADAENFTDEDWPTKDTYNLTDPAGALRLGTSKATGSITSKSLSAAVGTTIKVDFEARAYNLKDNGNINVTVSGCDQQSVLWKTYGGSTSEYTSCSLSFVTTTPSFTVTIATSAKRAVLKNIEIYYGGGGGGTTYWNSNPSCSNEATVTYHNDGAMSGDAPTDANSPYTIGTQVTVLGTGTMVAPDGKEFKCWNTAPDGKGTDYNIDAKFEIAANMDFYPKWVNAPYIVTFNAEGGTCGTSSLTEASGGAGVTLPAATATCATAGWSFYGWATSTCSSTTSAPSIVGTTGEKYYPTENITLHAVYKEGGYAISSGSFTQVTGAANVVDGKFYLITNVNNSGGMMYNTVTSAPRIGSTTNSYASCDDINCAWQMKKNGDYWQIYSPNKGLYAAGTGVASRATLMSDGTDDKTMWTLETTGEGHYKFKNKYNTAQGVNAYLAYSDGNGYACMDANGSRDVLYLYKEGSGSIVAGTTTYNSNPTCVTYNITLNQTTGGTIYVNGTTDSPQESLANQKITLTSDVTSGYRFTNWSVYKTGEPGTTVSVTNSTSEDGAYFTMPAYDVTVEAVFTAKVIRNIIWKNNGIELTAAERGSANTSMEVGEKLTAIPTLASGAAGKSCDTEGHPTFVGWTTTPWNGEESTAAGLFTADNLPTMPAGEGPITYHAVWADGSGVFELVTSAPSNWSGTYLIVNGTHAMSSDFYSGTSGEFKASEVTISNNKIECTDDKLIWIVAKNGDNAQYSFKNKSTGTYAKITGTSSTNAALDANAVWFTIENASGNVYDIASVNNSTRCFAYYASNTSFRTYAKNSSNTGSLYKVSEATSYITSCSCPAYSFHFGTRSQTDWSDKDSYCFQKSTDPDGNSGVYWYLEDFELPAKPHYYVGWQGSWNTTEAKSADADFSNLCFGLLRENSCGTNTLGTYSSGNNQGAIGTLRVRSNYTDNNKYIDFIPGGYVLRLSDDNGSSYSSTALIPASESLTETVWTTDITTVSAALASSGKFFVDLKTSSDHVWAPNISQITATSSMGYKKVDGSWGTGLSAGMRGKFRIWADNCSKNWNAHFVPYYHLSYDGNGAGATNLPEASDDKSCEGNDAARTVTVSSTVPTRDGYTFVGWATSTTHATAGIVDYTAGNSITLTADVTLYAVWAQNFTVTYDRVGGTDVCANETCGAGMTYTVCGTEPTKSGYIFSGWLSDEATPHTYTAGQTFTMPAANVTLTAQWTANWRNLTFNVPTGGGSITGGPSGNHVLDNRTFTFPSITGKSDAKWCWTFVGWTETAPNGSGTWDVTPSYIAGGATSGAITSDKTYYAVYSKTGAGASGTVELTSSDIQRLYTENVSGIENITYGTSHSVTATDGSVWTTTGQQTNGNKTIVQITNANNVWIQLPTVGGAYNSITVSHNSNSSVRSLAYRTTAAGSNVATASTEAKDAGPTTITITEGGSTGGYIVNTSDYQYQVSGISASYGPPTVYGHTLDDCGCQVTQFNLTYNANTANFPGSTISCVNVTNYKWSENDDEYTFCSAPTLAGYRFLYWAENANGSGNHWDAGETVTCLPSDNLTVYAFYEAVHTVTFNDQGVQTPVTQASAGATIAVPAATSPCSAEWAFVGWSETAIAPMSMLPTLEITAGEGTYTPTADKTLYAIYRKTSESSPFVAGMSGAYKISNGGDVYAGAASEKLAETDAAGAAVYYIKYTSAGGGKYTIQRSDGKYITYSGSSTSLGISDDVYYWTMDKNGNMWRVQSETPGRYLQHDAGYGFRAYTGSNTDLAFTATNATFYYRTMSCADEFDITFHNNGTTINWAGGYPEAAYKGLADATVISTFPTATFDGWTFIGWRQADYKESTDAPASSSVFGGSNGTSGNKLTIASANVDLYPVFTRFEDNEPFDQINGGDYYIYFLDKNQTDEYGAYKRVYAASYSDNKRYNSTAVCDNATTFTFTKLDNGNWTIYDKTTKKYLYGVANDALKQQASATGAEWTLTVNGNQFDAFHVGTTYGQITAFGDGESASFMNYARTNIGTNPSYHRVYLGSCTNRTFTTNPSTTPNIELHGQVKVTSTAGKSIKSTSVLTVSASNIATANLTVTSDNSTFKLSLTSNGAYSASVNIPVVNNKVGVTPIYVEYTPSATEDGIEQAIITVSDGASPTPTTATTKIGDVQGRHVPANFVIAAKWGDKWYALPANCTESTSSTTGVLIEVDNASDPTRATAAPSYTKWGLQTVRPSRKEDYGTRLVFTEQLTTETAENQKTLYNGSTTSIQANAMYKNYMDVAAEKYEWIPTTTDLKDYVLTSATTLSGDASARTVSLSNKGVFGTLLINKSNDGKVRILPAEFYEPVEMQVIEWKANSLVVMYGGAGIKATTQVGNNDPSSLQTLAYAKVDHGVYELSTSQALTSSTNMPLTITVKNGSDVTTGTCALIVPAIVTGAQDAPLGLTADEATLTDVVVTDGATLSAVATKYTFKNITVYPGGKLVIGSGKQMGMNSLTLRGGSAWGAATYEHKYPQFVVNNTTSGAYSNSSAVINYDYVTTKDQYYSFVLPYASNTKNIKYPLDIYGSAVSASNTGSFEFQYYDGAARAAGGTGWKVLAEPATLVAGTGYTFLGMPKKIYAYDGTETSTNVRQRYGIHRIPMSVAANAVQAGETNSAPGKATPIRVTLASKNNNSGWALVGNPYLSNVSGLSNTDIQVGKLVHTDTNPWDGKWQWDNPTTGVRYIVTTDDGQNFESQQASTATLKAFKNFFVQIQNGEATSLVIPANLRTDKNLAPARYMADVEQDIQLAVDLVSETRSDKVDLLINDIYTAEFDQDGDFTKMMNTTNFNLYGVYPGDNLSFIAVDKTTAAGSIAIGYQVPAAGEYTLQLSERPYVMSDYVETLLVTDHEVSPEVTTDLLDGPYNFHVNNAETNDARFTVSIKLKENQDTPTDIDIINGGGDLDGEKPIKFIYHDKMYILRNGVLYDATGKKVREIK